MLAWLNIATLTEKVLSTIYGLMMQRDLVGYNEDQQIRSGYIILDRESINDLGFFSKPRVYL